MHITIPKFKKKNPSEVCIPIIKKTHLTVTNGNSNQPFSNMVRI